VALQTAEKDMEILLSGDINVDISLPGGMVWDIEITTVLSSFGLQDLTRHFWQRNHYRHRWTWRAKRNGRMVHSRNDVVMGTDRRFIRAVKILDPPCFESDHQTALFAEFRK
jgi:hypothetical protein